jgi:poly-gamma-glutamate synthesis protein (capsule biosynthesis protein)
MIKNIHYYILLIFTACHTVIPAQDKNELKSDSPRTVTISFVGDLMCHTPQMNFARAGKDSFDFKPAFSEVKNILSKSDLTFGNLETTISGIEKHYSGYPLFNTPDSYLEGLKYAGFNFLLTANNHSFDRGEKGVLRTIEKIHGLGFNSAGTYSGQRERDSIRVIDINGIKLTVLAYTYGLNGNKIPKNKKYLVNVIDTVLIKQDINSAREKSADIVLVYFHFGEEYKSKPTFYQKEIVKKVISYGADLIIGSHPHVIQPLEFFSSNKNHIGKGIIAYSLGNFISNQRWRYSDCGVILNFSIIKNISSRTASLAGVSFIPTWIFKGKIEKANKFLILPADSSSINKMKDFLSKSDREKLIQSFNDTNKLFEAVNEFKPVK